MLKSFCALLCLTIIALCLCKEADFHGNHHNHNHTDALEIQNSTVFSDYLLCNCSSNGTYCIDSVCNATQVSEMFELDSRRLRSTLYLLNSGSIRDETLIHALKISACYILMHEGDEQYNRNLVLHMMFESWKPACVTTLDPTVTPLFGESISQSCSIAPHSAQFDKVTQGQINGQLEKIKKVLSCPERTSLDTVNFPSTLYCRDEHFCSPKSQASSGRRHSADNIFDFENFSFTSGSQNLCSYKNNLFVLFLLFCSVSLMRLL